METNTNQLLSQKTGSQSRPLFVKIIAGIALFIGISSVLSLIMFILPELELVAVSDLVAGLGVTIFCIAGGLGLLYMKRWGLYLFSILALYLIIDTIPGIWSAWQTLGIWEPAGLALIIGGGYILYGIISLVYLWSIRNRFR